MIAHLRGQLIENDGDTIVVDVARRRLPGLDQQRDAGQPAAGRRGAALAGALALHQGRAAAALRLRRRRRAPPVPDADRRAGRGAARGAGDPGRAAAGRAGARDRRRRRRAPDADQGRGPQDRRAPRPSSCARRSPRCPRAAACRCRRRRPRAPAGPDGTARRRLRRAARARLPARTSSRRCSPTWTPRGRPRIS